MTEHLEVSIVFPCLNEGRTVGACVERARAWLSKDALVGEVIVADNGSTDASADAARAAGARVVFVPTRGYGAALQGGIAASAGRFVFMLDADGSYDPGSFGPFLENLRAGDDIVVGNRFRGGIAPEAMPLKNRYLGNPFFSAFGRALTGFEIGDFLCGARGFRREAVAALGLETTGMEYAMEMLLKAAAAGLRVGEAPTPLLPDGRGRPPHLRPWRDGWRTLRFMIENRPSVPAAGLPQQGA